MAGYARLTAADCHDCQRPLVRAAQPELRREPPDFRSWVVAERNWLGSCRALVELLLKYRVDFFAGPAVNNGSAPEWESKW